MSDFLVDRLIDEVLFIYSVVDFFGFWYIKEGCKELKCYGVFFICMVCWVVYLEIVCLLDISFFINLLCCFIFIRGLIW